MKEKYEPDFELTRAPDFNKEVNNILFCFRITVVMIVRMYC